MSEFNRERIQARSAAEFEELLELARVLSTTMPIRIPFKLGRSDLVMEKFIVRRYEGDEVTWVVMFDYDELALKVLGVESPSLEAVRATVVGRDLLQRLTLPSGSKG